jgi:hypothetical protein
MSRAAVVASSLAVALSSLLAASTARAQSMETRDYRRIDRPMRATPQTFAFELRLGTYQPRIDQEFSGGVGPYEKVFGGDKRFYFGLEVDWQALRIPYLGTLGPGLSWGYVSTSSNAKISSTGADSAETTSLSIMPMTLAAVLRIDVFAREIGIPLVPYGKAGLGFGLWNSSNESGTSVRDGVDGKGHSSGTHFALGGMFLLDTLDPGSALKFDEEVGVNNSYVYFEWMWSDLGTGLIEKNDQMRIGTSSWVTGIALEF